MLLIHIKGANILTIYRILLKLLLLWLENSPEIHREFILLIVRGMVVLVIVEILIEDPVLMSIIIL
jgi:hypothetical protein